MAAKATDSDTGSLTPSEQSDGEERSEHDSDYETDEEEEDKNKGYVSKSPSCHASASRVSLTWKCSQSLAVVVSYITIISRDKYFMHLSI